MSTGITPVLEGLLDLGDFVNLERFIISPSGKIRSEKIKISKVKFDNVLD